MKRLDWLSGFRRDIHRRHRSHRIRRDSQAELRTALVEVLEPRVLLASDFGDAPDTALGTGTGDYSTLTADDGPSHTIVAGLSIGDGVDDETDASPNAAANGDDIDQAPDDEDGLTNPAVDLVLTIGAQPTVDVTVNNSTGSTATLYGWIDYNADGVFDNATERASVAVPDGTAGEVVTMVFPEVPFGFTGTTYARFRLSTDAAAADPTGAASDGEVEDYVATITLPSDGTVASSAKIAHATGGGPTLADDDRFGISVASLGDLDGDGVGDMAVGARYDDTGGTDRGAVYVQFMNADGTVKSMTKLASGSNGTPALLDGDQFGISVASLGDLNGDGVVDLAVGAFGDDTGGIFRGAVHVLFMNTDGTVASSTKIASDTGGGPTLPNLSLFGSSIASLGDLDGDGIGDMAVGAVFDATGGSARGAVYVLLMDSDGTVKSSTKIASGTGGGPALTNGDRFGRSLASLGDLDGDGIGDMAVAAYLDDTGGGDRGAVYVLLLNDDGSAKSTAKIASGAGGGPTLADGDRFGSSIASMGDLDGDGVNDLAVGARHDGTGGTYRGAVHVLFMNADGTVASTTKIAHNTGGGPALANSDAFGSAVASLGDLNGDGVIDLAVGARGDSTGGTSRGAVHVLFLDPAIDFGDAPDTGPGTGSGNYNTLSADDGPLHTIVAGLFMGTAVDGESDATANSLANGDDTDASPDDEDGLNNPLADLTLTVGEQPMVDVTVTNTTGAAATLYGWIDYNGDGVFDNATERASIAVPDATVGGTVALIFPSVPSASSGTTYARFRLSSDAAAADPTGFAAGGEVEDYTVTITVPSDGGVESTIRIADGTNGGPALADLDWFGHSVVSIGDLDGDGIEDLAVGAYRDSTEGTNRGAVYILFMNDDGTVDSSVKIASDVNGGPTLTDGDRFGTSVASIGDLDGDGINDLAVGAFNDGTGGIGAGAVHILFMNTDGTVDSSTKIADNTAGGPSLAAGNYFGSSVASLGDLDGDGIEDLAVGALGDSTAGAFRGAVYVMFLETDGTAASFTKISSGIGGGPALADDDYFGGSVTSLGDLDGDGIVDLAVGAYGDDTGGDGRGAVHVLFLNTDGTVDSSAKIADSTGGGPGLADSDAFGRSVASLGDLDGDGVNDLAVGADGDDTGGGERGALYLLFLNTDGSVASTTRIDDTTINGPALANGDTFGRSVTSVGDLDGNGVSDLAVGAVGDTNGRGAVHVLFMSDAEPPAPAILADIVARDAANGQWRVALSTGSSFDSQIWGSWNPANTYVDVFLTDVNGDGLDDVIGRNDANAQWLVSLSSGTSFAAPEVWATWNPTRDIVDVQAADFNDDGLTDIAGLDADSGQWRVNLSTGTSFGPTEFWANWNPTRDIVDVLSADFNGDGRADIAGRDADSGQWRVNLSTGTTFGGTEFWTDWNPTRDYLDVHAADFDDDGLADIAGRDAVTGAWRVNLSTGTAFGVTEFWATWNPTRDIVDVQSADFDGDGLFDIAGRDADSGQWRVNLSTGSSFTATEFWTDWNPTRTYVDVYAADFDGDGLADIAGRDAVTGVWRVNLSTGSSFAGTEFWGSWNPNRTFVDARVGNVDVGDTPEESVVEGSLLAHTSQTDGFSDDLDQAFAEFAATAEPESLPTDTVSAESQTLPVASSRKRSERFDSKAPSNVASLASAATTTSAPVVRGGSKGQTRLPVLNSVGDDVDSADTDDFFALIARPGKANPLVSAKL